MNGVSIDRKADYFKRSATERAADELEFQRRYQHGLRVKARLQHLQAQYKGYPADNVVPLRAVQ